MSHRDIRDMLAGALLAVIGLFFAVYGMATLPIGTLGRMGPGLMPVAVGAIVAAMGLIVLAAAFFRAGELRSTAEFRPALAILVALVVFAVTVKPFGVVPSVFATTLIASLAERGHSLRGRLGLGAGLAVVTGLVFVVGLRLQLALAAWPW